MDEKDGMLMKRKLLMLNGINGMTKKYRQLERKNDEVDKNDIKKHYTN